MPYDVTRIDLADIIGEALAPFLSAAEKEREGETEQMVTTAREVAAWAYKQGLGEALAVDHLCDEVIRLRAGEGDLIEKLREWVRDNTLTADWDGGAFVSVPPLSRFLNDLQEQSTGEETKP